jgi:hypothetical protein
MISGIRVGNEITRVGDDEIFGRNYRGGDEVDEIPGISVAVPPK